MGEIISKGIRWSSQRINRVPAGGGVFAVFNEATKKCQVIETDNMASELRKQWWSSSFWFFSWFKVSSPEFRAALKKQLEQLSYEELAKFGD